MIKYSISHANAARNDLLSMATYISETLKNIDAAERFMRNIDQEINNLSNFPFRYQEVMQDKLLCSVRLKPYMTYNIFYTVNIDKMEITILRVLKDKQDWNRIFER